MRTFPRELAAFREMVEERGAQMRRLSYEALKDRARLPPEDVIVASRPATIGLIVQTRQDGALRVVLQGLMKGRWFGGSNVALDGFYKHLDGTVEVMPDDELDRFD